MASVRIGQSNAASVGDRVVNYHAPTRSGVAEVMVSIPSQARIFFIHLQVL